MAISRLFVDPDRLTALPGDAQDVRIVPIATPHRQRTPGLDLLRRTQILLKNVCTL
jgi:hypothetical protein